MAFMTLKTNVFEKFHLILLFFLFLVYLLQICIQERSHSKLLASKNGLNGQLLSCKIWLHGFDSVFLQVFIEFLFVVSICFLFVTAYKIEQWQVLMPFYASVYDHKQIECFQFPCNGFHYFEINCFLTKMSQFLSLLFFVLFCLIVKGPYYGVVSHLF